MQKKRYKKYRSETVRLRSWDYGWNGVYFVTICADKRVCFFGEVFGLNIDDHLDTVETQNLASLRLNSEDKIDSNPVAKIPLINLDLNPKTCHQ